MFKQMKMFESIIIDDFKDNFNEKIIYSIFNLVDQDNKYLLINSVKPINEIKFKLPDMLSRSKNCLVAKIESPDDDLIFAIILKNFSDRQIKIEKKIIEFIINRIDRSYSKIYEFIYKIDELSLKKKKPINLKTIKEIL
jgi:chromosomal replication initiation ATPase DnaA